MRLFFRLLPVLFLFCSFSGSGQNRTVDSLKQLLKTFDEKRSLHKEQSLLNDSLYINALNDLSWEFFYQNLDTAIIIGKSALQFAQKIHFDEKAGESYQYLGIFYSVAGNFQLALENNYKAVEIWEKLEKDPRYAASKFIKKNRAKTLGNIGVVNKNQGNYPKALEYYFKALKIGEELKDKGIIENNYNNIGVIYDYQNDFTNAQNYYLKALKYAEEIGNKHIISGIYGNTGQIIFKKGDFTKALDYYFKALKIAEEIEDKNAASSLHADIAAAYLKLEKFKESNDHYLKALKIAGEIGNKNTISAIYSGMGSVFLQQKKMKDAEKYFKMGLALSKETGAKDEISMSYRNLYKMDSMNMDFRSAFDNYRNHILYQDSIYNEENTKKTVQSQMQYDFDKKEIAAKAEQAKKDARTGEEKERQNMIIYSVSAGLLLVLIFLIFIFRSFRQKQKANKEITKQKEVIEIKQKEILDSIYYARRIQRSLLPNDNYIQKSLKRLRKK